MFCLKNKVPMLVKSIKALELENANDLVKIKNLTDSIYGEWMNLKIQFRKRISKDARMSKAFARYEAEEELLVGMITLLNEKLIQFSNPTITLG